MEHSFRKNKYFVTPEKPVTLSFQTFIPKACLKVATERCWGYMESRGPTTPSIMDSTQVFKWWWRTESVFTAADAFNFIVKGFVNGVLSVTELKRWELQCLCYSCRLCLLCITITFKSQSKASDYFYASCDAQWRSYATFKKFPDWDHDSPWGRKETDVFLIRFSA